jgi:hypothetical protein
LPARLYPAETLLAHLDFLSFVFNLNAQVGRDGALRRLRRRAQRQATERMATRASYLARFVSPAPRGRGQRCPL